MPPSLFLSGFLSLPKSPSREQNPIKTGLIEKQTSILKRDERRRARYSSGEGKEEIPNA